MVWISAGDLNIPRHSLAGTGTQNAGLSFGGISHTSFLTACEKFNGSVWEATEGLLTALGGLDGAGTQNAGICFGGNNDEPSHETELFNGISWQYAKSGYLVHARWGLAGCGIQNAALAFGGYNPDISATPITFPAVTISKITEMYDGLIWSLKGNLIYGSDTLAGCGTSNAALAFGGTVNRGIGSDKTQKFNGSVWANSGTLNTARLGLGGCGTQSSALSFGGINKTSLYNITELFNGTSWTISDNMNISRNLLCGAGISSSGISTGGTSGSNISLATTEKFN